VPVVLAEAQLERDVHARVLVDGHSDVSERILRNRRIAPTNRV
jgi:hypothetical protein